MESMVLKGLLPNTKYQFAIRAANSFGSSPASAPSDVIRTFSEYRQLFVIKTKQKWSESVNKVYLGQLWRPAGGKSCFPGTVTSILTPLSPVWGACSKHPVKVQPWAKIWKDPGSITLMPFLCSGGHWQVFLDHYFLNFLLASCSTNKWISWGEMRDTSLLFIFSVLWSWTLYITFIISATQKDQIKLVQFSEE